jgi:8-amino-7-oxononanoate synthase
VPDGISRLRLTARADLSPAEVGTCVDVITSTAPDYG